MIINGIDYPIETPTYVLNENFRNFAPTSLTTVAVSGDEYTSAIILKTPRYYKNLDLSEYAARVYYYTHWLDDEQKSSEGSVILLNFEVQENEIVYVWQLDINQTYKKGRVDFGLSWSNGDWKLNTKGCYFTVQRFVSRDRGYVAPDIAEILQNEIDELSKIKQDKQDNNLKTEDKTVVGAINGLNDFENRPEGFATEEQGEKADIAVLQKSGYDLDEEIDVVEDAIYQCTETADAKNTTIQYNGKDEGTFIEGYFYQYKGNSIYYLIDVQKLPEFPNTPLIVTSEWLNSTDPKDIDTSKIYQCEDTGYGFIEGHFYQVNYQTLEWEQLDVQDLSNYYTKSETQGYVSEATANFITNTVNNLTNYYLKSETYDRTEVNNLIGAIQTAHFEIVNVLPPIGESNVIYLILRSDPETSNIYDEYIYINNAYEKIGSTDVDLTGYATESWVNQQISNFLTQSQIQSLINTALTNYYTKTETDALLKDKADVNGIYDEMIVGNAQNLVSTKKINDDTPYNFRTSGGSLDIKSGVGNLEEDSLVGGTVAWNQLCVDGNMTGISPSSGGWSVNRGTISFNNNALTFTLSDASPTSYLARIQTPFNTITNHKYLLSCDVNSNISNEITLTVYSQDKSKVVLGSVVNKISISSGHYNQILSAEDSCTIGNLWFGFVVDENSQVGQTAIVKKFQIFDLTQMFGESIANHIYSLEQTTTGTGITYFRTLFPKNYYEYNSGTLLSVKTSAHKMTGFNAYNPATGTAKLVGNRKYQITGTYTSLSFEGQSVTLDSNNYYTPSITGTLTITGGNNTDTCVHLVWDGVRDNEYEGYKEYNYPLDSNLELKGIPKLDVNNKLYYDGDEYKSDGTVTRKYGKVDLGTLTWSYSPGNNNPRFQSTIIENLKISSTDFSSFILCSKYTSSNVPITANNVDKTITVYNQKVYIHDESISSSATSSEIQAALSGVYLIYELQTPTTESVAPFTNPQYVDDWGTEEYVDNRAIAIPVGHNTKYTVNLKAKLEMAPNSPNQGDGDYLVRQTDGVNEYVKYIAPVVDQTYDPTSTNAQSGTAVAEAVEDKLTEPSSGLAVGKYFRVASIDADGHAVLECVDLPEQIFVATYGVTTYSEISEARNADKEIICWYGPRLYRCAEDVASAVYSFTCADNDIIYEISVFEYTNEWHNSETQLVKEENLNESITTLMTTEPSGTTWSDAQKNGCYNRTTIRKTILDSVLVPNAKYDLGSTEQASLTLTLPTPSSTDNYSGNEIYVAFKSGTTPTDLNIIGTFEGDKLYIPSAECLCELTFKYIDGTWVLFAKETTLKQTVKLLNVKSGRTSNFFGYRPSNGGLQPNTKYRLSLDWQNIRNASFSDNLFVIYTYYNGAWTILNNNPSITSEYKTKSYSIKHGIHYDIDFTTTSPTELREFAVMFGDINKNISNMAFRTANWKLYTRDNEDNLTDTGYLPDFTTVQFRDASDNAMNNWISSYSGTDRGQIWRKTTMSDLSSTEYANNYFNNNDTW